VQAPGTQLIDVFDRLDHARLILGALGAGKTTLLLTLAWDLLVRVADYETIRTRLQLQVAVAVWSLTP